MFHISNSEASQILNQTSSHKLPQNKLYLVSLVSVNLRKAIARAMSLRNSQKVQASSEELEPQ